MEILNRRNIFNATVIASVSAIELAAVVFAPQYPIECALVGTFIGAWATALRLPVSGHPADPVGGKP